MKPRAWSGKRALSRLDRLWMESPIYFVTACTAERQPLLAQAEAHAVFREFCQRGAEHGIWVGRYVLMPDHFHAFLAFEEQRATVLGWMKSLKNKLSSHWRAAGVPPPHWQRGFFDRVLRAEESYAEKWEYVWQNPVRAGLVERAEDWPYQGEVMALRM